MCQEILALLGAVPVLGLLWASTAGDPAGARPRRGPGINDPRLRENDDDEEEEEEELEEEEEEEEEEEQEQEAWRDEEEEEEDELEEDEEGDEE